MAAGLGAGIELYQAARDHGRRFIDDLRLLDDLGWERRASEVRDEFPLTMAPEALARVLGRLSDNAAAVPYRLVVVPIDEREQSQRALTAIAAYSELLAQITTEGPANPADGHSITASPVAGATSV